MGQSNSGESEAKLFFEYLFLTKEILKCVTKKDEDLLLEIISQRDVLQEWISECQKNLDPTQRFIGTAEGKMLLQQINDLNQEIMRGIRIHKMKLNQQNQAFKAYDGDHDWVGFKVDWKK